MKRYYFLGIGGIGMSAIARYFHMKGFDVCGYDRTRHLVCRTLEEEGILIHYEENINLIPQLFLDPTNTIVIYTPAIPHDHKELCYFKENGFKIYKRAEILGEITRKERGLCVAGTHGKTTTSTILAHLLHQSSIKCNAFLGGISNNYNSNLLLSTKSDLVVIEADEYDRSFHQLQPYMAIVTSVDADHLDIYENKEGFIEGFAHFTSLIQPGGCLIMKQDIPLNPRLQKGVKLYRYSGCEESDFYAKNIRFENGELLFDFVTPEITMHNCYLGVPALINVENSVAAMAVAWLNGAKEDELKNALKSYSGIYRRFNLLTNNKDYILIDDYAHHPTELNASIESVRKLYPQKHIVGVFQPHLYTRTRDFADGFAHELSKLDEVILLPIYPARELPIEGVTSEMLLNKIENAKKTLCSKEKLVSLLLGKKGNIVLTLGAGDIDALVPQIAEAFQNKTTE